MHALPPFCLAVALSLAARGSDSEANAPVDGQPLCSSASTHDQAMPAFDGYCAGEPDCMSARLGSCSGCTCHRGRRVAYDSQRACDGRSIIPCGTDDGSFRDPVAADDKADGRALGRGVA
ncbi:MAG: hypothetical protein ACHREM_29575 [Polyangiales bacterium]